MLPKRNNVITSEHSEGSYPCGCFLIWVYVIVCYVIIPTMKNPFDSKKEDFCTPKGIFFAEE